MIFAQIFDTINTGLVVLDRQMVVHYWNRWMALHSHIQSSAIVGHNLFDFFPDLNRPHFLRNCKSVLTFGNFCFFSQKLHHYLFPMAPVGSLADHFDHMQQSCAMGPLRNASDEIEMLYLSVQDVTEVVSYQRKLMQLNQTDQLTGVYNRNYMEAHLAKEIERCKRFNHNLSLLMIDVDLFKSINDTYGHPCGDYALKAITQRINSQIRKTDALIRYGGDEFCCILTETSCQAAYKVAEQLRQTIAAPPFTFQGSQFNATISVGVASLDQQDCDLESLLKKADDALYRAKQAGRNTVT
ncbi:sensor domain-containing diguanylate cyclase [Desulfuromonas thiophila]|uniref:diguanylate cyclase n=1 Tax=Desulfuromonas thiophila TaxID=57664 RepID=A0A1G6Z2I0_9BACT|nr:sensor domain-containing diguanylate cyclase [Desulfuromonas thiophila]SDD96503.1 diguanylate cyclase with PAS/PAC sensor [Desulfuromonas thiophila]